MHFELGVYSLTQGTRALRRKVVGSFTASQQIFVPGLNYRPFVKLSRQELAIQAVEQNVATLADIARFLPLIELVSTQPLPCRHQPAHPRSAVTSRFARAITCATSACMAPSLSSE